MSEITLPLEDAILQFTLLVVTVLGVQRLFYRTPVPSMIGLLIIGMLVGPGGGNLISADPVIELFGSIGLLFIMFLAGLEIDLKVVRAHKPESATFGILCLVFSFAAVVALGVFIGLEWAGTLLLGAALASHTLISYPVVQNAGLIHRRPIVAAVGGTLVTDTAALVILVVVLQVSGAEDSALGWAGPLGLLTILAAAALFGIPKLARMTFKDPQAGLAENALFALAVLMVLAAVAELIGTKDILGAFIAGLALNLVLKDREVLLDHVIFAGRMLFIPFFFIQTGMKLELAVFGDGRTWVLAGLLTCAVIGGKSLAAWMVSRRYGFDHIAQWAMTGMTIPQAAATLAVISIANDAGLIDEQIVDAVIMVIFVTCLSGVLLTRRMANRMKRTDRTGDT